MSHGAVLQHGALPQQARGRGLSELRHEGDEREGRSRA